MDIDRIKRSGCWPIVYVVSLLWLTGCSLGIRTDPGPPPTAVSSPTPTIIAPFTAVPTPAEGEMPTDTPEPTATSTRRPTATATISPPTSTPLPTPLPTLTANQLESDLLPALIFQAVDNGFGYPLQRVTWEYGLRSSDYCQHGPYRWLSNEHLLLYPLVGQTDWFEGAVIGEVTWPVVTSLAGEPSWGVAMPLTDRCELPVWSSTQQQVIEVDDEIRLRSLQGEVVATYAGAGPLHLAPSGQRLLAGNQWLDLQTGITTTTSADWRRLSFARPAWTGDETQLFGCCFAYTDGVTGNGWLLQGFPGLYITGVGVGPGFFGTPSQWVAEDTAVLVQPLHITFWDQETEKTILPLLDPVGQTYVDLIEASGISDTAHNCAPYASPTGTHIFITCRELNEDLLDQPHLISYLVILPSLTVTPITGLITVQGWSSDGRFLAYTEYDDETGENGRVWLLTTDGERRQLVDQPAWVAHWHPTEPLLALRFDDTRLLYLLQAETGEERLIEMDQPLSNLAWQPDGEGVVLQTADNTLWWLAQPLHSDTRPLPLTPAQPGESIHSLRWSPGGTKLAYVHENSLIVLTLDDGLQTVRSDALNLTLERPSRWIVSIQEDLMLFSDEWFGLGPTPLRYYVYASEFPNPDERPFADLVTADLGHEIQANFSYTSDTIGPYTVYRTEQMPSMSGALTVFFELPGRYLALALTPFDSEQPYQDQERYLDLFETMLHSVAAEP